MQIVLVLAVNAYLVCCEPPLSNQYGVPGNFAGSNNQGNHGGGGVTNSYGAPIGDSHDENQDYIDSQVTTAITLSVYQTCNLS